MLRKLEEEFIRQCAPTLAGLKIGSLFRFSFAPGLMPAAQVADIKNQIENKGLKIEILSQRLSDNSALIYVYRDSRITELLKDYEVQSFLRQQGYKTTHEILGLLYEMSLRINMGDEFPHAIGVLLGYPLADVLAYINAPRDKGLCTGCWKVYNNPEEAQRYYEKCAHCTRIYWKCFVQGFSLQKLAVAA